MRVPLDNYFWLPQYMRLVEGRRQWCLLDLLQGEFHLINAGGAHLLLEFDHGRRLRDVLRGEPSTANKDEAVDFLVQSIDKGILVPALPTLTDRDILSREEISSLSADSLSLTLELTNHCNHNCQHCYNCSGPSRNDELTIAQIGSILHQVAEGYENLGSLTITGGEPFLFSGLEQVLVLSVDVGFRVIRINTNGTITPSSDLLEILQENAPCIDMQFTFLGGQSATHDQLSTVRGSFDRMLANVPLIVRTGCKASASILRWRRSISELDAATQLAESAGLSVSIGDIYPLGRALQNQQQISVPSELAEASPGDKHEVSGKIPRDKRVSLLEEFPPKLPCGRSSLAVSSDGSVLPCTLLQGVVIGNISQEPIAEIVRSTEMASFYETVSIENRKICAECELRYVCGNKCPAVTLGFAGKLGVKNPFCEYYLS